MSEERWLPVVGWEGYYEVSDQGHVRSVDRVDSQGHRLRSKVLKTYVSKNNKHPCVNLFRNGKRTHIQVHHEMMKAFAGPAPEGKPYVLHYDDDPTNNVLSNLRWGSKSDNEQDKVRNGRHLWGNRTHCPQGHEYTDDNTYIRVGDGGARRCRECKRIRGREYARRKRALRKAAYEVQ